MRVRTRAVLALFVVALAGAGGDARGDSPADPKRRVEHEPIPSDPANDVALGLRLDGDLPAAIETQSGLVAAPDPRAPLPPATGAHETTSLAGHEAGPAAGSRFTPDTDTRRPESLPYTDPFVPSTAPWKRLVAFDTVNVDGTLRVGDPTLHPMPIHEAGSEGDTLERFYGDLPLDLRAHEPLRIPSVGPGARIAHARLGMGGQDLDFEVRRDGAENWFIESGQSGRARLVLELVIPRAAFGGSWGDSLDDGSPARSLLPSELQREASLVAARIGVPKPTRHETLEALVDYFRGFTESNDPPAPDRSIYLALALSKKGVCRHRAYAFMVTASGLGFRTRVVLNEAHAWVEVWNGKLWKRVDLGGAGTVLAEATPSAQPAYAPPPDPFRWPPGARRGEDLGRTALAGADATGSTGNGGGSGGGTAPAVSVTSQTAGEDEARVPAIVTLETSETSTSHGQPVHVRGTVMADGAPCAHVTVAISARQRKTGGMFPLGDLATDEHGAYAGTVTVTRTVGVGDYDLYAVTPGDARCRKGTSP